MTPPHDRTLGHHTEGPEGQQKQATEASLTGRTAKAGNLIGKDEALERIDRVTQHANQISLDIAALYEGQAWKALGYADWDELCDAKFEARIKLPIQQRQELVSDLATRGLSSRAIGSAIGVSYKTVQRDIPTGINVPVTGMDGRVYKRIPQPGDDVDPRPLPPEEQEAWDEIRAHEEAAAEEEARIDALSMKAAASLTELFEDDFWVREWSEVYPAPEGADPRTRSRFTEWLNWRAEWAGRPAMPKGLVRRLLNAQQVADRLLGDR